jgi:hypothetical protein
MSRYLNPRSDLVFKKIFGQEETRIVDPELLAVPEIREAIELSEEAAYTKAELASYDTYWDTVSTEKTMLAEREALGEARGEAIGEARGKAIGAANMHATAKKLLAMGMSIAHVAEATGLSEQTLKQL